MVNWRSASRRQRGVADGIQQQLVELAAERFDLGGAFRLHAADQQRVDIDAGLPGDPGVFQLLRFVQDADRTVQFVHQADQSLGLTLLGHIRDQRHVLLPVEEQVVDVAAEDHAA